MTPTKDSIIQRRLAMDFQPIFMAGQSLKDRDPSHWERKIRPNIVPVTRPICSICAFVAEEKRSLIHLDEVWAFPGPPKVVLTDVRPLCTRCHDAKDYAHLLNRIRYGTVRQEREADIRNHYCNTNKCSEDEFQRDLEAAWATKITLEEKYGPNCRVDVDYGPWSRSKDKPRLSDDEKELVRKVCENLGEPIFILDRKFGTYRAAIRTLQSMSISQRTPVFEEFRDILDGHGDDEAIVERDEGIQFK